MLAVTLVGCAGGEPDAAPHEKANKALLRDVPTYPNAELHQRFTIPQRKEEGGPILGYTTISDYTLPPATRPEDVESFYRHELEPAWRFSERLDAAGSLLRFRSGDAALWIDPDGSAGYELEVAVNHDYFDE